MQSWLDSIQAAIAYIEDNLTETLDVHDIAARAYVSAFHFQRIFSVLCGMPLGEYIRRRRLTLAAQELVAAKKLPQGMKVIDVAVRYGYDSPDSFARAFRRFHGVLPSQVHQPGVMLQSFAPMKIALRLEGGSMLEYKIVEKPPFTVVGYSRKFSTDTSYQEIPKYWQEVMAKETPIVGAFGVCIDSDGKHFDYLIADMYLPWQDIPADCVTRVIPGGTWAVFPCRGALPEALQSVNTRIWSEWLPSSKAYRLAGSYNIEMYAPPAEQPEDNYSEIWVPVEKA